MPVTWRRHERQARRPVDPHRVADLPIGVQFGAHQRIAALGAINDEIQRNRLVSVGLLNRPRRQDAVHRPQHMGHGTGLREVAIAQQDADTATVLGAGIIGRFPQFCVGQLRGIQRRHEAIGTADHAQVTQQRLIVDVIQARIL